MWLVNVQVLGRASVGGVKGSAPWEGGCGSSGEGMAGDGELMGGQCCIVGGVDGVDQR
jgi:hypothetical protein